MGRCFLNVIYISVLFKELATPFKTIIEMIVEHFIDKGKKSHEVASNNAIQETETSLVTTVTFLVVQYPIRLCYLMTKQFS